MLITLDTAATHAIYSLPHTPLLDGFFYFFSFGGILVSLWVYIFVFLVFFEELRHRRFFIDFSLSIIISSILTNIILKNIFHRLRPLSPYLPILPSPSPTPPIPQTYPSDFSFPSGHATFAFAAAYILSHYDPKRAKLFYIIACLTAFSRVYLGFHYVSDVIAGALVGIGVGILITYETKRR